MNTGIVRSPMFVSVLVLYLLSGDVSRCQEATSKSPSYVTIPELSLHPQSFDGHLVRVQALLALSWEGDNFMSDPDPQRIHATYVWFHCRPDREAQIFGAFAGRWTIHGSFTGYFHFAPRRNIKDVFDPGPFQFEAVEVSIPEPQPRSLSEAIRDGDLEETYRILRSKPNLNVRDEYQSLPLFEAASSGHTDIAEELLAAGADPKLTLPGGDTALMQAAWNGNVAIAKALLDRGAPVNAANDNGETALIFASQTCPDGKMVQLLLDAGADPNAGGGAALMAAAGNPLVVEKLLAAGADPRVRDKYGNTAESESCDRGEKGHAQVCALVRQALGKK